MYWLGKRSKKEVSVPIVEVETEETEVVLTGAERLDGSRIFSLFFGGAIFLYACYIFYKGITGSMGLSVVNPNFINILLEYSQT